LSGSDIPNKPNSYDSTEFGEISQKMIIATLKEVFGAKPPKHIANKRELIFDEEILKRLDMVYSLADNIKIIETDETDETHVGLEHYTSKQESEGEKGA
jgi:hypothetical protein